MKAKQWQISCRLSTERIRWRTTFGQKRFRSEVMFRRVITPLILLGLFLWRLFNSSVSVHFLTSSFVTFDGCKVDIEFVFGRSQRLTFVTTWAVMGLLSKCNDALCGGKNAISFSCKLHKRGEVRLSGWVTIEFISWKYRLTLVETKYPLLFSLLGRPWSCVSFFFNLVPRAFSLLGGKAL